jgi:cold-inducible RNA-binding protein
MFSSCIDTRYRQPIRTLRIQGAMFHVEVKMKNLFVGNMSFQATEGDLRALFEQYGEVSRIQVITDRDTGQARGFGFVEMSDDESAAKAIVGLNGQELDGRALNVNEARPKTSGGGGRGDGAGGGGRSGGYGGGRGRN